MFSNVELKKILTEQTSNTFNTENIIYAGHPLTDSAGSLVVG
jgi:hypothetical protein